ncbi:MAG: hypothetical protein ACWGOV_08250, partial [Acidiferrobacterales bacterium]
AVPSYARQTGLACAACHTIFPELTPFGRSFKLNGYTLTGLKQIESQPTSSASGVKINEIAPMSAMLQMNVINSDGSNAYEFPGEFSLFFAGEISPKMGSFIQMTMAPPEGEPNFSMDNADIRYANRSGDMTYGVTVNNSPTVQDLWNSTPVWGYPFTGGASIVQPLIADGLGQAVMGIGGYAQWSSGLYAEATLYGGTDGGLDSPLGPGINGVAIVKEASPYVRLAWQKGFSNGDSLMVGAYGMQTSFNDSTGVVAGTDKVTDMTIDTQYELHLKGGNLVSVHGSYTNEKQDAGIAGSASATLNAMRLDATYHMGSKAEASIGYAANSDVNDDQAVTVQYSYLPWQNTKLTTQYVHYNKSAAGEKDALLLQAWLMW